MGIAWLTALIVEHRRMIAFQFGNERYDRCGANFFFVHRISADFRLGNELYDVL